MKVFLSWSGDRSKAVAEGLGAWLAQVIQAVDPWISSGIEKGARWQSEIAERLDEAKVGIVCLTSGNLTAPWILFEAGALSKTTGSHVCTFLLDVAPTDVKPPLAQFQHTLFTKNDVLKLVQTINNAVNISKERSLTDKILVKTFGTFWPQLETQLTKIKNQQEAKPAPRPERELLEEVLEILRSQERQIAFGFDNINRADANNQRREAQRLMELFNNPEFRKAASHCRDILSRPQTELPTGELFEKSPPAQRSSRRRSNQ